MHFKSAFLNGDMTKEIYIEKPPSFEKDYSLVYQLNKSLHGLKHAPKSWYEKIDHFFIDLGLKQCEHLCITFPW